MIISLLQRGLRAGVLTLVCVAFSVGTAGAFGKNKVQYRTFKWQYIQTAHFKIYFYPGGEQIADFTAEVAEAYYQRVSKQFFYELKRRVPLIIYDSHNEFKQTNVLMDLIDEEVGGFTELFKNRVVLPFMGSYEAMRHVVEHELTHAVMFEMIYGSNLLEMLYNLQNPMPLPLWFMEGMAEFQSLDWDVESDAIMRDAIVNERVRSIEEVGGYLIYKGGQSFMRYLAQRYGRDRLGDVMKNVRMSKNLDKAFKAVLGEGLEELDKAWLKDLKKTYWPEVDTRSDPADVARQFTDHVKDGSYLNVAPAFLAKGDKIVFLSDRRDYNDLYIMSAIDGTILDRVVKGERTRDFESMSWLRSKIACAPDNRRIAFVAVSRGRDVIYLYDIQANRKTREFLLDFDAIAAPAWGPGEQIAFTGVRHGQADLYLLDAATGAITRLTDDIHDDIQPAWSPDGEQLAFASDRDPAGRPAMRTERGPYPADYGRYNIFLFNLSTRAVTAVTSDDGHNISPSWAPDNSRLVYSSSRAGVPNLYIADLAAHTDAPLTNTLTACYAPQWSPDGRKIVFTQYQNGGWDVFLIRDVNKKTPIAAVPLSKYYLDKQNRKRLALAQEKNDSSIAAAAAVAPESTFSPAAGDSSPAGQALDSAITVTAAPLETLAAISAVSDTTGPDAPIMAATPERSADTLPVPRLASRPYALEFSPDFMSLQFYLNTLYGAGGFINMALSDVLGNHRFYIALQSNQFSFGEVDFTCLYYYLPQRTDVGAGMFRQTNMYGVNSMTTYTDLSYGAQTLLSYPFDKFSRIDLGGDLIRVQRDIIQNVIVGFDTLMAINTVTHETTVTFEPEYKWKHTGDRANDVLQLSAGLAHDNVLWGITGPVNGSRAHLMVTYSPRLFDQGLEFTNVVGDVRQYFKFFRQYSFVTRLVGGSSSGRDRQKFFLGGTNNCWFGPGVSSATSEDDIWAIKNFYFGSYVTPLRGVQFYNLGGNNFVLGNVEFRYPFINQLSFGWPFGFTLRYVRGSLFVDAASAWDQGARLLRDGRPSFDDVRTTGGIGFGTSLNIGFAILRWDVGWQTDFSRVADKPYHYWSLQGGEF
jgi:Tol biopolymer transport system component